MRGLADGRAAPDRSFRGEEGNSSNGFPDMLIWLIRGRGRGRSGARRMRVECRYDRLRARCE